jgi:hypothetical protein
LAGKIGSVGEQFSNVALPAPRLIAGYPIQVNNNVLPARGIGLIIATDNDPRLSRRDVAVLPLPLPDTPHDRWDVGSALGGEPYLETLRFRVACTTFIASAKVGPDASHGAVQQLASIVESLRQRPARGRLATRNGLITGTLSVCCDAYGRTPEAGVVVIGASNGTDRVVHVGRSGRFSVSLLRGRYSIVGGIPTLGWSIGSCTAIRARSNSPPAEPAIVKAGARTNVIVNCQGQ